MGRIPTTEAVGHSPQAKATAVSDAAPRSHQTYAGRVVPHFPYLFLLVAGTAFLLILSLLNHRALNTGFDLSVYDQTVWNLSRGELWRTTLVYETNGYYDHFEPILLLFVPFYWLWPDVRILLAAQALTLASGSLPLYLYARERLHHLPNARTFIALLLSAAYLAYPPLHYANLNDFHDVSLLPPLLGFALYGLLTARRRLLYGTLALSLLVKEDAAIMVLAFGLYIALLAPSGFRRRDGFFLSVSAILWGVLVLTVFYPAMTRGMAYPFISRRYPWLGDTPDSAARVLLTRPWVVLPHLMQRPKIEFLSRLFGPLLFLPLLGWPVIGLAFPILGYLMLSSHGAQWSVQSHYNPPLLPIIFFALIHFFDLLQRRLSQRWAQSVLCGLALLVAASVGVTYYLTAPGPGSRLYDEQRFRLSDEDREAYHLMAQVPANASLGTIWSLAPHLSQRPDINIVLDRPELPPDYLLVEERPGAQSAPTFPHAAPPGWPPVYHEYGEIAASGPYRLLVLQRSVSLVPLDEPEPLPAPLSLAAFAWLDGPTPAQSPPVAAGQEVRLMQAWRRTAALDQHYVFFIHLLDTAALTPDGQPTLIAQNDQEPGRARFPTIYWDSWTEPPLVLDEHRLFIPEGTTPGQYEVWVGAYEQGTLERIELGGAGQSLVSLGVLEVTQAQSP